MTNRQTIQKRFLFFILGIISVGLLAAPLVSGIEIDDTARRPNKKLSLSVNQEPLGDILNYINEEYGVKVLGVEDREEELITFDAENESVEKALRRLLRQLNEANYVFVYSRTRLKHVAIYPKGTSGDTYHPVPPSALAAQAGEPPKSEKVVKVLKVNEDTQAATLDIQVGDLVVEYDGNRIQSAQELVRSVKKKSPDDTVEMVLVRNGDPIRLLLNGGLIGINIRTVSVPSSELSLFTY